MWKSDWNEPVRRFVEAGGTLIVSALTATRDVNNHIHGELAPATGLGELLGVRVLEFGRLAASGHTGLMSPPVPAPSEYVPATPIPTQAMARQLDIEILGQTIPARHLYERLELTAQVDVMARWSNRFLKSEPALTCRRHGKGQAIYIATYLTDALASGVVEWLLHQKTVEPIVAGLAPPIEATLRSRGEDRLLFLVNTGDRPATTPSVAAGRELLSSTEHAGGPIRIEPYGARIIRMR